MRGRLKMDVTWLAIAILSCAVAAGAAMKIGATTIPLPEDDDPVLLTGLDYPGYGWTVSFTSIEMGIVSDEGEDPLKLVWTMTADSSRPLVQKANIEITLEDGDGKKLKTAKKFVVVRSNADGQEIPIKMKVKREDWALARAVHIKTTYTVL